MRDALGRYQTVAIFGAGSEIASATLLELLRDGPLTALLCARVPETLDASRFEAGGATIERHAFDALAFDTHAALVEALTSEERDLDLALVSFGVLGDQQACEQDAAAARLVMETNLTAAVSLLTPLVERLLAQGHGTVVVLSSVAAVRARRSNYVYGASKAGLDAFCQGLQQRLQGSAVRLVIVRPGFVRTKMTAGLPVQPLATDADSVAAAIVKGLRDGSGVVWAPPLMRLLALVLRAAPARVVRSL